LRFAHNGGGWYGWQEGRWRRDELGATVALAQQAVSRWWADVGTAGSPEERQILSAHYLKSGTLKRLQAMLTLAGTDPRVRVAADAFDRDPWLLTVANGTIDLRAGSLRPHRPSDLISKRASVAYRPAARCPRFLEFLQLIFSGDQALIDFVQRAAGYSATGSVREQCLFFLWGGGANGKSTLLAIFHMVLGEHARVAVPSLLMATKHESHPTEVADLMGARPVSIETKR
jgi:putative DNA primase/helicase